MALVTADFILTVSEKCHHFTLTESLLSNKKINLLVARLEFEKRDESGRGRHLEQKIWFLTINQVQPILFL